MKLSYKLESFEGPLDLLLHLIEKDELDIYDIPISRIADQYLAYIRSLDEVELESASEFLVMAATLLSIKSRMLLPKPPVVPGEDFLEEEDPREELVRRLLEYRKYKEAAEVLRGKELERSLVFSREPTDLTPFLPQVAENPVKGLFAADLFFAFQQLLKRNEKRSVVTRIRRDEISVKERVLQLLDRLRTAKERVLFSSLFEEDRTRDQLVVTFLAVLELMKRRRISCHQHGNFAEIVIAYRPGGEEEENQLAAVADEIDY